MLQKMFLKILVAKLPDCPSGCGPEYVACWNTTMQACENTCLSLRFTFECNTTPYLFDCKARFMKFILHHFVRLTG